MNVTAINSLQQNSNLNKANQPPSFQAELRIGKDASRVILEE